MERTDTITPAGGESARQLALEELQILDTPAEERFDRVTRLCTRLFGVPMALVSLIDNDRQWFKSRIGLAAPETPRDMAFCNIAIQTPNALVVEDAQEDDRFSANPLVTGEPHIRFYAGYPLETRSGHRVGTLCILDHKPRKITVLELGLLQDLALWVQKELIVDEELDRAAEVQQGLLPRRPPNLPGYEVAARVKSSWLVGGDFFDWYPTPDGAALCLADVMGKGMGGAILMATVRAVLRGAAAAASLADGVAFAATALEEDLAQTESFFTLFMARVNGESGTVTYVDAGHGLAFVAREDGTMERLMDRGLPVGMLPETRWDDATFHMAPGDTLVVCSDGILDANGPADTDADVARILREVATVASSSTDMQAMVDHLTDVKGDQPDDVTVLVMRRL